MDKPESICTCKQCKKNFPAPSKRFSVCSPECQAILDAAYVRPPRPTITLTCQYCAQTVTRKAQRYEFGKYCSRPCAYAGRAITRAAKAAEEKALREAEKRAKFMVWVAERTAQDAAEQQAKEEAKKIKYCVMCCGEYDCTEVAHTVPVCSLPCLVDYKKRKRWYGRNAPSRRAHRSASKAKRRMLEANTAVDAIDPLAIFQRDEWCCYICGIHTPRAHRGSNLPDSPELEHVVSLADGGTHTWANLACACRTCNGLKGSTSFFDYQVNIDGPQTTLLNA